MSLARLPELNPSLQQKARSKDQERSRPTIIIKLNQETKIKPFILITKTANNTQREPCQALHLLKMLANQSRNSTDQSPRLHRISQRVQRLFPRMKCHNNLLLKPKLQKAEMVLPKIPVKLLRLRLSRTQRNKW
jgi:hypothetical protein